MTATVQLDGGVFTLAPFARRLLTSAVDTPLAFGPWVVALILLSPTDRLQSAVIVILFAAGRFGYPLVVISNQTIGERITGIRAVAVTGEAPNRDRRMAGSGAALLDLFLLGVPRLRVLWGSERRTSSNHAAQVWIVMAERRAERRIFLVAGAIVAATGIGVLAALGVNSGLWWVVAPVLLIAESIAVYGWISDPPFEPQ